MHASYIRSALTLGAIAFLAACATTGATFNSGVGDAYVEHPPYYAGASMQRVAGETNRIGHLPIAFQSGAAQPALFDPRTGRGTAMDSLLSDMNEFLDALGVSTRLVAGGRVSAVAHAATRVPPDVRFGCIPEYGVAGNDCAERGDSALGRGSQQMLLAVGRPSREWIGWISDVMRENGTSHTLVVTLEIGDYLMRQQGLIGRKVLELGTGHTARLPWLSSLETPVSVLQLTAALVGPDGKALRIGAEGFHARRSRLLVSALGAQELLGDADVSAARTQRRDDLPGAPLAWQVALRELVTRVTGQAAGPLGMTAPDQPAVRRQ